MDSRHASDLTTGDRIAEFTSWLVSVARTVPMMSPRRVILVLHADGLLVPRRDSEATQRAFEQMEDLLSRPDPQSTLVFVAGSLDRRSRIFKLFAKHATLVDCGVIEDQADAERWIRSRVAAAHAAIDPAAARLLASRGEVSPCGRRVGDPRLRERPLT